MSLQYCGNGWWGLKVGAFLEGSQGATISFNAILFQAILKQLTEMGFREARAKKALVLNR